MDCIDSIELENLDICSNEESLPGVNELEIYGAPVKDFEVIAEPPKLSEATSYKEAGTISESHIFKEGKGFHRLQIFANTGTVDSAQIGEVGRLGSQNSLTGAIPNDARSKGYLRRHQNQAMIYIVRDRDGKLVQLGSKNSAARVAEFTGTTGTAPGDAKNIQVIFRDSQPFAAPQYDGTIQEFPAPAPTP